MVLGFDALYRSGLIGAGFFADFGASFLFIADLGAQAGLALRTDSGLQAELLARGGVRHYFSFPTRPEDPYDAGTDEIPGQSVTVPFAGAAARFGFLLSRARRAHFNLGVVLVADHDLGGHQYAELDGLRQRMRGLSLGVGLGLGVAIDLVR
jgi:hypothetical protein